MLMRVRWIVLSLLLVLAGCDSHSIVGNGEQAKTERTVASFSRIDIQGNFVVHFKQASQRRVQVEADSNIIPVVLTSVKDGKLLLSTESGVHFTTKNPITVNVSGPTLLDLTSSGSNVVTVSGLKAKGLSVFFTGSGEGQFSGEVNQVNYKVVGTARINAKAMQSKDVDVVVIGAGELSVSSSDFLDVSISGIGNVTYYGDPKLEKNVSGLGKLIQGNS